MEQITEVSAKNPLADILMMRGAVQWALKDLDGKILKEQLVQNVVVTIGRAFVLKQLNSVNHDTNLNISHMAIGSGTVAPVTGNTALGGEVTRKAISSIATANLTSATPNIEFQCSFASNEGNTTIGEVGLFQSSAAGVMLCRATIASFVKDTSNTFALSYVISN